MSRGGYLSPAMRTGARMGDTKLIDMMVATLTDPFCVGHMGITAENLVTKWGITREEQDALAVESHRRAAAAIAEGRFDRSLVPVHREDGTLALDHEEFPRPQTTREGLAGLKPAFTQMADVDLDGQGTTYRKLITAKYPDLDIQFVHHAGNSSGVNDGAAALLMASEAAVQRHDLQPIARIVGCASAGIAPRVMARGQRSWAISIHIPMALPGPLPLTRPAPRVMGGCG
mgnify:CR=1 FL=1